MQFMPAKPSLIALQKRRLQVRVLLGSCSCRVLLQAQTAPRFCALRSVSKASIGSEGSRPWSTSGYSPDRTGVQDTRMARFELHSTNAHG